MNNAHRNKVNWLEIGNRNGGKSLCNSPNSPPKLRVYRQTRRGDEKDANQTLSNRHRAIIGGVEGGAPLGSTRRRFVGVPVGKPIRVREVVRSETGWGRYLVASTEDVSRRRVCSQ